VSSILCWGLDYRHPIR